jgi:HEAT repeat protein
MRWIHAMAFMLIAAVGAMAQPSLSDADYRLQAAEKTLRDRSVAADGPALLEFFRHRTLSQLQLDSLSGKIKQLGATSYRERAGASADLIAAGEAARPLLLDVIKHRRDNLEVFRRAELCLRQLQDGEEAALIAAAARLLAQRKPADGAPVLLNYLPFAVDAGVVETIHESLPALAVHEGRPDETLVKALNDRHSLRRSAAGAALIRAGALHLVPGLRDLLKDADPEVRLHITRAMIEVRDKSAVPILIELIAILPSHQVWQAEEMLSLVAGEDGPQVFVDARHAPAQVAKLWKAWWHTHEATLDLTKFDGSNAHHGFTLITQMDNRGHGGRVFEIRPNRDVLWQIDGLRYPVDAQVIGRDRVLIAEYLNRRVTERDFKGNVKWERQAVMPIGCQRLPNGDTFIATRRQLLIVDASGKETFTYNHPGTSIAAARRLRDGQFIVVTSGGTLERLDARGHMVKSFSVGQVYTLGGSIDVLPGGRVLVPQYRDNKVVEYDADGRKLWEARVSFPTSAVRLPNGNVLVVSMLRQQVMELTRDGREAWTYRTDGRPWRARRR